MDKETFDIIMDAKYEMAFSEGNEGIINLLDRWLDDWLFRKDHCPKCSDWMGYDNHYEV